VTSAGEPPLGLIAGDGRLPLLAARGARRAGRRVVVLGIRGFASPRLAGLADEFLWVGLTRVGAWLRALRRRGIRQAVLVGGVRKREMYSPWRFWRHLPDLRTARIWYGKVRRDRRDNAVLLALAEELASEGVELMSSVEYCKEHLAVEGLMTRTPVPAAAGGDLDFGWRIARASADLDIGQSVAVHDGDIIAVEAIEGTDEMILRAGRLCPRAGWTLVKVARPRQDMRFDVPTVGPETLRNLKAAGCACLLLEAGRTLIVDKPVTLELADRLGIAVLGRRAEGAPSDR